MTIIIVCAYCQKRIGTKEGGEGVSHGACPDCHKKQLEEIEKWVKEQQNANRQK